MKRELHRDPRPGLPTAAERRKTTERINSDTEKNTDKQVPEDVDSGNPSD